MDKTKKQFGIEISPTTVVLLQVIIYNRWFYLIYVIYINRQVLCFDGSAEINPLNPSVAF